jgi:hypothetical protein
VAIWATLNLFLVAGKRYCMHMLLAMTCEPQAGEPAMDAVLLTYKHKPSSADERKRIEALGGTVVFGRLFGDLAVSRAFGDRDYKKPVWEVDYVSVEPFFVRPPSVHICG